MFIIHAGVYGDSLALWAETSDVNVRKRTTPKGFAGRRYVFSASPQQLKDLLEVLMTVPTKPRDMSRLRILLPTYADGTPIPSSGMISEDDEAAYKKAATATVDGQPHSAQKPLKQQPPTDMDVVSNHKAKKRTIARGRPKLVEWWADAVILDSRDAIAVLCHAMGERVLAPGVIVGEDLGYMADVMRLAGSLVARQQYLPDMRRDGDSGYLAVWRPVVAGADSVRFDALASKMPGVVWALLSRGVDNDTAGRPPRGKPAAILASLLELMVNGIIRGSASERVHGTRKGSHQKKRFDSIHDAWIYKLCTPKPEKIDAGDAYEMHKTVRQWQTPVMVASDTPIRLCFRLEEPEHKSGKWFVRYMLQSRSDPSLLVSAGDELDSESSVLPKGANVKEFLLTSLGHASGIFPKISDELANGTGLEDSSHISGCVLDAAGAYAFLTRNASALEQAGYGVIFPSWWTGRGTKARIKATAEVKTALKSGGMFDLGTVVDFDWKIAVGNQNITLAELRRLADAKAPLVQMRGQWMEVSTDDIKDALSYLKKRSKGKSLFDVIKMKFWDSTLGGADADGGDKKPASNIDIEITSKDDRITEILDQLDGKAQLEDLQTPDGFEGTLRPYQMRGFSWMWFLKKFGLGGCLADDMGLGKTIQILVLIQHHMSLYGKRKSAPPPALDGSGRSGDGIKDAVAASHTTAAAAATTKAVGSGGQFLLVCPTSVISNWKKEASRFVPGLSVHIHHGADRSKSPLALKKQAAAHDIVVSSYGLLQRDLKKFKDIAWQGVILDEAQNIKNYDTKQARAARSVKALCRFALTGTPVENNIGDMWSIMEFLNPGFLGTQAQFKRDFFLPIQIMQDESASRRLKTATGPFILRRLKTDKSVISDLPDKIEAKAYCTLTREQASLYEAVLKDIERALAVASGMKRRGIILSSLARLKQVCDHPALFLQDNSGVTDASSGNMRSGKLERLIEMMSEVLAVGDKALVFTQFVEMGHILKHHLQNTFGQEVLFLHGGTPRGRRDEMVGRFQDDAVRDGAETRPMIFVISVKAGGTGLNLTAASHVFHYDRWWNPAVEDQATDRAYRIGQKKNVQVHKMICPGTLEEKIDLMIERKKDISKSVVGTGEGWITEMSNEDLRNVLALSSDATSSDVSADEEYAAGGKKRVKKEKATAGKRRRGVKP